MRALWVKSNDPKKFEVIQAFDDAILIIDAEIQEILIADELTGYTAYLDDVI